MLKLISTCSRVPKLAWVVLALTTISIALGQSGELTYVPGSSVKLYQVNGDCDWVLWDATIGSKTPTCKPTASQTVTKADVLGDDVPVAFEHNGELIVTFGDTIGAAGYKNWTTVQNSFQWSAHDPIAHSTTTNVMDGLLLNFFLSGTHGLEIEPPPQPNGKPVDMTIDNVPNTGVSINGQIFLGLKTGSVNLGPGDNDGSGSYSVLATFDETSQTFTSGRTISALPDGRFVSPTFYLAPAGLLGTPPPVSPEPVVLIFGLGQYRASNVFLSIVPSAYFASGVDSSGQSATRYFVGMKNGQPVWSASESDSQPVVTDLDPANPTIGNVSVSYSQSLGLWFMVYDGGRGVIQTTGMYFTYAAQPWGPWSKPQLVFNDCRDKALGNYIFYYYAKAAQNNCPSAMPAGVTSAPNSAGPSGPVIGSNDPATTRGGAYAPAIVERFTTIFGSTLKLYYMFSTWNPYAVVMMESDFNIAPPPVISLVANAEGESSTIAPNTWVEIKGSNLAPAGDMRVWQESDFVNNQMPTQLDGVSVTVNGKNAYVYYISPAQINILTPPDAITGPVKVVVINNGSASQGYTVQAQPLSPSFFVFNGGPYVAAAHAGGNYLGPANLYPGATTPGLPGEVVSLYANGFGPTSAPVVGGSSAQSGNLSPLPVVRIGGIEASVQFAGLVAPGQYLFNVVIPLNAPNGDNTLSATYNGATTAPSALITIQNPTVEKTVTFYVAPNGNDSWSGTLAGPNGASTDGPFATFDHARAAVQSIDKTGLQTVSVQFRGGTYFLPATELFTAADSGTSTMQIVYENFPDESPLVSGGVRVKNWTNTGGNTWKTTLPASTQYFQNLFYNGVRRLRPRLGVSSGSPLGTYYRYVGPVYLNAPGPPAAAPDPNCSVYFAGSGWECYDRFQYQPTDPIASTWKNLAPPAGNHCGQAAGNPALAGDIELVNFEQYSVSKLRFSCVDTAHHIAYLTGVTATEADHPTSHGFIPNHRYLIENVQDDLTQPGQWFLDRSTTPWTLTYLANEGENPNADTVIIPQFTQVVAASNLQYVTFKGLTFAHDNYTMPAKGYNGSAEIIASVSFQNSGHITFDSSIVTQTSGVGLEFISCIDKTSPSWCISHNAGGVAENNLIANSAFYELAADAIRIGTSGNPTDTNANVPQFHTVQNNVVEGYGRVYPGSKAITQGQGHDNLYTHNEIYDGYKGAIKICYCANSDVNPPFTNNNVISFNHVYNLFQGLMNDSGSLYFGVGTPSPPSSGTGNKMLNNKVHDVNDASVWDSDGYGGDGLYADDFSGGVDMENNLVYRVSGSAISFSGPRAGPNQGSTVKNNVLAYARQSLLNSYDPYSFNTQPPLPLFFTASNNLLYFDRNGTQSFYVQGGCAYAGEAFPAYQVFTSNLYWRTDGAFASDPQAFHVQSSLDASGGCGNKKLWSYYAFTGWQGIGEDIQSVVQNPGFNNPAYPADDYTLPKGSPGAGFVVFDPSQAGRTNPVIRPPAVPATFPVKTFNPATDF